MYLEHSEKRELERVVSELESFLSRHFSELKVSERIKLEDALQVAKKILREAP